MAESYMPPQGFCLIVDCLFYIDCLFYYGSICGGITCVWCLMCSDLERGWTRGWRRCSGWDWGGCCLLVAHWIWVFEDPLLKKPCPGLIYPSSFIFNRKTPTEGLTLQRWRHILQVPHSLAEVAVASHCIWSYTDKLPFQHGFYPPSISQCQALRRAFLHEYSHWNAKFVPANPPWERV